MTRGSERNTVRLNTEYKINQRKILSNQMNLKRTVHPRRCQLQCTELAAWFLHVRTTWRNIRLRRYGSLQHNSREQTEPVMGYGQDILSGQQLVSQLRGDSDCFPHLDHLDNIMTTEPFPYNISVPELNWVVNKADCEEVKTWWHPSSDSLGNTTVQLNLPVFPNWIMP